MQKSTRARRVELSAMRHVWEAQCHAGWRKCVWVNRIFHHDFVLFSLVDIPAQMALHRRPSGMFFDKGCILGNCIWVMIGNGSDLNVDAGMIVVRAALLC
jgi:hypothetical protein